MSSITKYKKVLAIDQGIANIGYSIISRSDDNTCHIELSGSFKTKSTHRLEERLALIYSTFDSILEKDKDIQAVVMEDLFVGVSHGGIFGRSTSIVTTSMVSGILFLLAKDRGLKAFKIAPTMVKKCMTGCGKASKDDVQKGVLSYYNVAPFKVDHECDSIAIGTTFLLNDEVVQLKESTPKHKKTKKKKGQPNED